MACQPPLISIEESEAMSSNERVAAFRRLTGRDLNEFPQAFRYRVIEKATPVESRVYAFNRPPFRIELRGHLFLSFVKREAHARQYGRYAKGTCRIAKVKAIR